MSFPIFVTTSGASLININCLEGTDLTNVGNYEQRESAAGTFLLSLSPNHSFYFAYLKLHLELDFCFVLKEVHNESVSLSLL